MSGYMEAVLVVLAINVIMAYAAALPLSAGLLNLGTAGFMAVGAYVSAYLSNEIGLHVGLAIVSGAMIAGLIAVIIGIPVLRTHGMYLALATLALGQVLGAVFLNLDIVGGAAGYPVMGFLEAPIVLGTAVVLVVLLAIFSQSRFWLYLTAIKNDPTVCDLFGVGVRNVQLTAFAVGGVLAGIAGGLYAHHFSYIEAQHFSATLSIYTVLFVILGGTQTIIGPLVGAAFFTFLPEALRASAEWRFVVFAVFIIIFMVLRPQGMITSALLRKLRSKVLPRKDVI